VKCTSISAVYTLRSKLVCCRLCTCVYMCVYVCTCVYTYLCISLLICRERNKLWFTQTYEDIYGFIRTTLQHPATLCNTLQHTATHFNTLQRTACNARQHTAPQMPAPTVLNYEERNAHAATHCNKNENTATHCNALQHKSRHCYTIQPTVRHCNMMQYALQQK